MDFSEKDAARSKFKLSRKNQRGRGRSRGGRGGPGKSASTRHTKDLGSNLDRYDDGEGADMPSEGPVARSQGADLALWLEQNVAQDPTFFTRQRINLNEEVGLPPAEADSFQGLSFDLKALAACLASLPLHEVLRLPPSMVTTVDPRKVEEERAGEAGIAIENITESSNTLQTAPQVVVQETTPLVEERKKVQRKEITTPSVSAIEKAVAMPPVVLGNDMKSIQKPKESPVVLDSGDEDAELDALLGLGGGPSALAGSSAVGAAQGNYKPAGKEDDLEAWLDAL